MTLALDPAVTPLRADALGVEVPEVH